MTVDVLTHSDTDDTAAGDAWTDLGGGISIFGDPAHHYLCDGTGRTRAADPDEAVPVACPTCRPHLQRRRTTRRSDLNRPRLVLVD